MKIVKIFSRILFFTGLLSINTSPIVAQNTDLVCNVNVKPHLNVDVSKYQLTWSDEFNTNEVDESKWGYRLDSKHLSTQLAKNITVSDGLCHINLLKEKSGDKEYTGGGIISKKYFGYGYYEARIKCPGGAGWHSSFWMMDSNSKSSDSSWVELDPLETNSIDLYHFTTDYHQWISDIGHVKKHQKVRSSTPLNEFHIYGMEWTPDAVYFYFDGKLVKTATRLKKRLTKEQVAAGVLPEELKISDTKKNDVQIMFSSIATFLGGTESVDDSMLPASVQCDYIRFFEVKK